MKEVKIGLDLDSVIIDMEGAIYRYLQSQWGVNMSPRDLFVMYDFSKNPNLTPQESEDLMRLLVDPDFILNLKIHYNAYAAVRCLLDEGVSIHYITGRPDAIIGLTKLWLERHGLFSDTQTFLHSTNGIDKSKVINDIGIDAFVEDNYNTITMWLNSYKSVCKYGIYLVDRPWNKRYKCRSDVTRVGSLYDAVAYILREMGFKHYEKLQRSVDNG